MSDEPLYGYCPKCGAPGKHRTVDGEDTCENGHIYNFRRAINRGMFPMGGETVAKTTDQV